MLHCLKYKMCSVHLKVFVALILCFTLPTLSLGSRQLVKQKGGSLSARLNGKSLNSASWSSPFKMSEVSITSTQNPTYPDNLYNGYQAKEYLWDSNQTDSSSGVSSASNSFSHPLSDDNLQAEATSAIQSYDVTRVDSYFPENYHGHYYGGYEYAHHNPHKPEFEIEDKLFTKTIVATKVLKAGKAVFTLCMILVVLVLAGLGKSGVALSPAALPLALLPIGFIALILFVPLFLLYVPIVATGHAGGEGRRRKRHVTLIGGKELLNIAEIEQKFSSLEHEFFTFVKKLG